MDQLNYQVQAMTYQIRQHVIKNASNNNNKDDIKQHVLLEDNVETTQEIDELDDLSFA
jgi:hypothetical protein